MTVVVHNHVLPHSDSEISFKVKRLVFDQNREIQTPENGIFIITGPNNSGKSQLLREISQRNLVRDGLPARSLWVLKNIEFDFYGTTSKVCNIARRSTLGKGNESWFLQLEGRVTNLQNLISQVEQHSSIKEALLRAMLTYLPTSTRLLELRTSPIQYLGSSYGGGTPAPILMRLHENPKIEEKINNITKELFGLSFVINRFSFQDSRPHLFDEEIPQNIDRGSDEIARWFEAQPLLEHQGDGINAFCGILSTILADPRPLVVLDEPELFLHPPQIRQLARIIATETPPNTQMFIATHSDEFVRGMIEFGTERVSVMRITRNPKKSKFNNVRIINSSNIEEFWREPLLKTSDALSSLFYNIAIVVEGDSDARFFMAMLDVTETDNTLGTDLRFFHCGGKDRIHKIASAFRAIGITTMAIVDIDVLESKEKFLQLVDAFGGIRDVFAKDLGIVLGHIASKRNPESVSTTQIKLNEILEKFDSKTSMTTNAIAKCQEVLKIANPWSAFKIAGVEALEYGEQSLAMERIINNARSIGIIINEFGELESLWKYTSGSKAEWLAAAIQQDLKSDPKMKKAREFIATITKTASDLITRNS